ncbi:MAG: methyltransferase [archaeon]
MKSKNPLISLYGFDYLIEQAQSQISKTALKELVSSLYLDASREEVDIGRPRSMREGRGRKHARKKAQLEGVLGMVKELFPEGEILEICSGSGALSELIAEKLSTRVTGVDMDVNLVEKAQRRNGSELVEFKLTDILNGGIPGEYGLVVALHACGYLSDRVLSIAAEKGADVVCVPCCYGKMNQQSRVLPRSAELSKRVETYQSILKKLISMEGCVNDTKDTRQNLLLETYRRLVDFDRVFYLRERGYEVSFRKISERRVKGEKRKHFASSLDSAIVGSRN